MYKRIVYFIVIFGLLVGSPALALHSETFSEPPEWFCSPAVEEYIHGRLPASVGAVEMEAGNFKLLIIGKNNEPMALVVHEMLPGQDLGKILYFETLPEKKILCNRMGKPV